ncbi:MAG: endolytic transglycosylase MltG [Spirochaetia bacterium]|nr:endolytic transglycosylase MltG [Spirochaetia bacterium]
MHKFYFRLRYFFFFLFIGSLFNCDKFQNSDESVQLHVIVKQGERFSDFCRRLESENITDCRSFDSVAQKEIFSEFPFLPKKGNTIRFEGMFRPGNYEFTFQADPGCFYLQTQNKSDENSECLAAGYSRAKTIAVHILKKSEDRYLKNQAGLEFYKEAILASIIEKEAASNKSYKFISSVFHNRLKQNMVLGSCPTVEYALGYHRPFLLFKDLELNSPYNVYKRKGLPPTPISFFSDEALEASRNPADTEYVFFVFDWTTGELSFSEEYEQHKKYAKKARENFIGKFGKESVHKEYPDKYYEL